MADCSARQVLDLLQGEPRSKWDALLLGKGVENARRRSERVRIDSSRRGQMLAFSAGVAAARAGGKVEKNPRDQARNATARLFDGLAGRDKPKQSPAPPAGAQTPRRGGGADGGSRIDRVLRQFSPRSGGGSARFARKGRAAGAAVNPAPGGAAAPVVAAGGT